MNRDLTPQAAAVRAGMPTLPGVQPNRIVASCHGCGSTDLAAVAPGEFAKAEREHFIAMRRALGLDLLMASAILLCLRCDWVSLADPETVVASIAGEMPEGYQVMTRQYTSQVPEEGRDDVQ